MERWIAYALISMAFAGATATVAKRGLDGISAEVGIAVRIGFVFAFIAAFAALTIGRDDVAAIRQRNVAWLALSAFTTAISWVFFYKAIHAGEVATVSLIDKGS